MTRRRSRDEDNVSLNAGFVQAAAVVELSAAQREAKARRERLEREFEEGRQVAARTTRAAKRRRRRRRAPLALVLMLLGAGVVWLQVNGSPTKSAAPEAPGGRGHSDRLTFNGTIVERPRPSREQARSPLGVPVALSSRSPQFRFNAVQEGTAKPVAHDPCRPIHIVVNSRTAPAGADAILNDVLAAVTKATGLQFRVDGPSAEGPSEERLPYQADRYPDRWAPVLVAWSDPEENPRLAGRTAGLGGSVGIRVGDQQVYVTGGVTLDGPQLKQMLKAAEGHAAVRSVIEHEFAHLVGLDHVADASQLMHPVGSRGVVTFGAGDLTGLSQLGEGACFPDV